MMEELAKEVIRLVAEEYRRAAAEHGAAAHSPHEGYALIKEEVEEAQVEMETLNQRLDHLWGTVKGDEDQYGPHYLMYIKRPPCWELVSSSRWRPWQKRPCWATKR